MIFSIMQTLLVISKLCNLNLTDACSNPYVLLSHKRDSDLIFKICIIFQKNSIGKNQVN